MAQGSQTKPTRNKKKRKVSRFQLAVGLFVAILAVSGALAFLLLANPFGTGQQTDRPAVFGVQKIEVVGDTRYDREAIIAASGIRIGQSIFSVNKIQAHDQILEQFPYIHQVDVGNASFDTIEIRVAEVEAIGALYSNGHWMVIGSHNKTVEELPMEGDRPGRYLYVKGVSPQEAKLGGKALDDRDFKVVTTLLSLFDRYQLTGIGAIDLSENSNIQLEWNQQITVYLGNESNLENQISLLVTILPQLLEDNGNTAAGRLDMRSYADDNTQNDQAVFTPWDLLHTQSPTGTTTGTGSTSSGTGSAAGTTAGGTTSPSVSSR